MSRMRLRRTASTPHAERTEPIGNAEASASAVFRLQRSAGNAAVSGPLTSPAAVVQPISAPVVQRDLDDQAVLTAVDTLPSTASIWEWPGPESRRTRCTWSSS
jgi:hypothetical protein